MEATESWAGPGNEATRHIQMPKKYIGEAGYLQAHGYRQILYGVLRKWMINYKMILKENGRYGHEEKDAWHHHK